ncbi:hypothetical protein ABIE80_004581 [Bradyrhizobium diazoefficiens]
MTRHVRDLRLRLQPFGDVLEGRDPAAALHRLVDDPDGAAKPVDDLAGRTALARVDHEAREEFIRVALPLALGLLFPQHVDQEAAGQRDIGATKHRRVALVEQHDLAVRVEHAQPLRHVLERGIEHDLLASQFALGAAVEHSRCERDRDDRDGRAGGKDRQGGRRDRHAADDDRRIRRQLHGAHGGEMMRDDGDGQQHRRTERIRHAVAPPRDDQRKRSKDDTENDRDRHGVGRPADARGNLERHHAGVMHCGNAAANDGATERDRNRPRHRHRDAQPDEGDRNREDQRQNGHGDVVGAAGARPVSLHRDEMGCPDAAACDDGVQRDPRYASTAACRTRALEQADRRRAREQAHCAAECDEAPVMLVRETVKNLIHCRPLSDPH